MFCTKRHSLHIASMFRHNMITNTNFAILNSSMPQRCKNSCELVANIHLTICETPDNHQIQSFLEPSFVVRGSPASTTLRFKTAHNPDSPQIQNGLGPSSVVQERRPASLTSRFEVLQGSDRPQIQSLLGPPSWYEKVGLRVPPSDSTSS